jgi:hypothetical protein
MLTIRSIRRIGAVALIVPTGDHLIAPILTMIFAPALMSEVFGAGAVAAVVFFVCLGVFQLVWIGVLLKSSNRLLLLVGILGNLVSIIIYFVSLSGVTIFGVPPQNGGAFALLIKGLEAVFVLASLYLLKTLPHAGRPSRLASYKEEENYHQ